MSSSTPSKRSKKKEELRMARARAKLWAEANLNSPSGKTSKHKISDETNIDDENFVDDAWKPPVHSNDFQPQPGSGNKKERLRLARTRARSWAQTNLNIKPSKNTVEVDEQEFHDDDDNDVGVKAEDDDGGDINSNGASKLMLFVRFLFLTLCIYCIRIWLEKKLNDSPNVPDNNSFKLENKIEPENLDSFFQQSDNKDEYMIPMGVDHSDASKVTIEEL
mmetsp:Transcript_23945/g.27583  ORF Transcript_23945/g.27583 Transcript_23945/m.27583 type:complete len:220 (+) Transcript_23945:107-766(+)